MNAPRTAAAKLSTPPAHHYATGTLHRAIVSLPESMCPRHEPLHERIVFFDRPHGTPAGAHLETLLALAWNIDTAGWCADGRIYNIYSARELIFDIGASTDPDHRLFETGWGGPERIHFANPAHVDLLVAPRLHARLLAVLNHVHEVR